MECVFHCVLVFCEGLDKAKEEFGNLVGGRTDLRNDWAVLGQSVNRWLVDLGETVEASWVWALWGEFLTLVDGNSGS